MRIPKLSDLNDKNFLALAGNLVISGFGFLIYGVLCRVLTKEELGIWFFFLAVYSLADAVRNGLLTTATVKFYAGALPERAANVLGSVWFLAIALTGILMLVDFGATYFIPSIDNAEIVMVIQWFGITFLSSLPFNVTFWILVAEEDYFPILYLRLLNNGSTILIIIILAFLKMATLYNVFLVNVITNLLTSAGCILLGFSKFKMLFKRTRACTMELLNFGKFSLATSISSNLMNTANTFLINFMLKPEYLAVYNVGTKLMEAIEIPLRSFVGTGMSAMATAFNNHDMARLAFVSKKYAGMLTLVFVPVAIVAFLGAGPAIWILGGDQYMNSAAPNILRILMLFAILYPIDRFNGVTLDIIHQPKINFYKVLIMGAVNLSVGYVGLLLLKNVYGIAIATPCATIAGLLFGYYHLRKHIDYSFRGIITTGHAELMAFGKRMIGKYR